MKILIVADNASTRFGGEAFIPFNYFRLLRSRNLEVLLVVHARNKKELTELFPNDLGRLHFVEDTYSHKILFHLGNYLPRRLADATTGLLIHLMTQFVQRRVIKGLVKQFRIQVVHQPIPVSPKMPSQIFNLGAAVIIGPLNGGMEYPPAFQVERGVLSSISMTLGRSISLLINLLIPGKRLAKLILVANARTRRALPWGIKGRVEQLVENGVDLSIWQRKPADQPSNPVTRLIFVGRLIDWKALEIVFAAVERARKEIAVCLEVIGDGPMRHSWETMANQMGLKSVVKFFGFLSQPECAERLRQADIFVLPSLFECGGAVVLEAMAVGLPVIATAWGGPLDYLDSSCGILVEPSSREGLVEGFSNAIVKLAKSPSLRTQMGQCGHDRARQNFGWERKIDKVLEFYASVAGQ